MSAIPALKERRRALAAERSHIEGRILKLDDEIAAAERVAGPEVENVRRGWCRACAYWHITPEQGETHAWVSRSRADAWARECKNLYALYAPRECEKRVKSERVIAAEGLAMHLGHGCGCEGRVVCGHGTVCECQHIRAWERAQ